MVETGALLILVVIAAESLVAVVLQWFCSMSVLYLLGGSGVTCPRGVVVGVGGFRSPAASAVELLPEDWGVCGPWREPPEFAGRQR